MGMPWFKYQVGSLDDPFIFDLIDTFGSDGYLIYFGCVDIIADEFDVNNPGFCQIPAKFMTKKLQVSVKKLQKVLNYCTKNEKKIKKLPYICAVFDEPVKGMVRLECNKLADLADDYTRKKMSGIYGKSPENSGQTPEKSSREEDKDKDKDKDISTEIFIFVNLTVNKISKSEGNMSPKKTDSLINNSADTIDKLIRLDNFTLEYIKSVLEWGLEDDFWKKNILSLASLRKKGKNDLTKFQNLASSYNQTQKKDVIKKPNYITQADLDEMEKDKYKK